MSDISLIYNQQGAGPAVVSSDPRGTPALGDLNGDGILDWVRSNRGSNTVSVLIGQGNGRFSSGSALNVGT